MSKNGQNDTKPLLEKNSASDQLNENLEIVPNLSKRVLVTYGVGEVGVWASHVIIGFYLNTFLLEVAGLEASSVYYNIFFKSFNFL